MERREERGAQEVELVPVPVPVRKVIIPAFSQVWFSKSPLVLEVFIILISVYILWFVLLFVGFTIDAWFVTGNPKHMPDVILPELWKGGEPVIWLFVSCLVFLVCWPIYIAIRWASGCCKCNEQKAVALSPDCLEIPNITFTHRVSPSANGRVAIPCEEIEEIQVLPCPQDFCPGQFLPLCFHPDFIGVTLKSNSWLFSEMPWSEAARLMEHFKDYCENNQRVEIAECPVIGCNCGSQRDREIWEERLVTVQDIPAIFALFKELHSVHFIVRPAYTDRNAKNFVALLDSWRVPAVNLRAGRGYRAPRAAQRANQALV
uniref:Uncharacterized protein n=1 Tax=Chromera velia CCMP2878 TaxID=1169474 RepID=A0A0G4FHK4_9ALVE|eukprot:Cvel_16984.t1-p1 / transcript=Cvel_16984.t1 / gene=Cvel_16984 / organism=Chromera_velia_CCMP2878 / gene_product=hypothetical protein / transcript_product=hypothetical protein / location=Cvel_scaffold1334:5075-6022(-) / protein_length=316 / sequence_SO=supercontig / SO=protein_coding / is_pseudo=false